MSLENVEKVKKEKSKCLPHSPLLSLCGRRPTSDTHPQDAWLSKPIGELPFAVRRICFLMSESRKEERALRRMQTCTLSEDPPCMVLRTCSWSEGKRTAVSGTLYNFGGASGSTGREGSRASHVWQDWGLSPSCHAPPYRRGAL